jgi:hypothetical protein
MPVGFATPQKQRNTLPLRFRPLRTHLFNINFIQAGKMMTDYGKMALEVKTGRITL